ncbi:hypothetical protein FHG87_005875 [Trinorchestia longiramus]|nr:hypothetical protein FHG87_005875 [Trinorchestia longiramus]
MRPTGVEPIFFNGGTCAWSSACDCNRHAGRLLLDHKEGCSTGDIQQKMFISYSLGSCCCARKLVPHGWVCWTVEMKPLMFKRWLQLLCCLGFWSSRAVLLLWYDGTSSLGELFFHIHARVRDRRMPRLILGLPMLEAGFCQGTVAVPAVHTQVLMSQILGQVPYRLLQIFRGTVYIGLCW